MHFARSTTHWFRLERRRRLGSGINNEDNATGAVGAMSEHIKESTTSVRNAFLVLDVNGGVWQCGQMQIQ
jgi:hypothetical protein